MNILRRRNFTVKTMCLLCVVWIISFIAVRFALFVIFNPTFSNFGEMGKPVILPKHLSEDAKKLVERGWKENGFNQYISDIISVNRSLPDLRKRLCRILEPSDKSNLPLTSVIICFHNEAWSTLLRTVHSVLNRSPPRLIKEIILVDDFSDKPHTKQDLETYMSNYPKVKIIRTEKREGIVRSRILGIKMASAPVLTFLDSHCECTNGWLEPLLDRIRQNPRTVVSPIVDSINNDTFAYEPVIRSVVGGFTWNLDFKWISLPDRERRRLKHSAEPVNTPVIAGGIFSINKSFFVHLGTYDKGLDIWGRENLELSFKVWMCGGILEIVPCSRVGHVFRDSSPYEWGIHPQRVLKRNAFRVAKVWLDEYGIYFYERYGNAKYDYGDVSVPKSLRNYLKCKSFKWYLENVYPERSVPGKAVAYGEIYNMQNDRKNCLESGANPSDYFKPISLYPCRGLGTIQYWRFTEIGEIHRDDACLGYINGIVTLHPCDDFEDKQLWKYIKNTKFIQHHQYETCLAASGNNKMLITLQECDKSNPAHKWNFGHFSYYIK